MWPGGNQASWSRFSESGYEQRPGERTACVCERVCAPARVCKREGKWVDYIHPI